MPHQLTDRDTMISVREVPWHGLGKVIPANLPIDDAMLEVAGLNWSVSTYPMMANIDGTIVDVPERKAVVRSDTREILSTVGPIWQPFQNREVAAFLKAIVDTGEAIVETAGSLRAGRRVWFLTRLPKEVLVGGKSGDQILPYLLVANGHDGTMALHLVNTPVRVVCANTLGAALGTGVGGDGRATLSQFSIKHTGSMHGRVQTAREALRISFAYFDKFGDLMNRLSETEITDDAFRALVNDLIPARTDPNKMTEEQRDNLAKKRAVLLTTYAMSPTVDRGTAYGAYNAVTEWFDHTKFLAEHKGGKTTAREIEQHAESVLLGTGLDFKNDALARIVKATAKA